MDLDPDEVRTALESAVHGALPGEMVTRWVALVEVIDGEGERCLWLMSPAEQKAWETLGMLRFAEHIEQAKTVRAELGG